MNVNVHYRITQDRAGIPQDFSGARHFVACEEQGLFRTSPASSWLRITRSPSAVVISRLSKPERAILCPEGLIAAQQCAAIFLFRLPNERGKAM